MFLHELLRTLADEPVGEAEDRVHALVLGFEHFLSGDVVDQVIRQVGPLDDLHVLVVQPGDEVRCQRSSDRSGEVTGDGGGQRSDREVRGRDFTGQRVRGGGGGVRSKRF